MDDPKAFLQQAVTHHQAGDVQQAAALYRRLLQAAPDHADAQYLLATAELQLGRFDESIRLFEQLIRERGGVPDLYNNLGVAYQALGQWEAAAKSFEAAIRADAEYARAFFNLGALMEQRSLLADAEKCFRRALELNAEDLETRTRLGNVLKARESWSEAEACYRQVATHRPDDLDLAVDLAFVLARQEKLDEAADVYRHILRIRPDYAEVHNSLSYVYERQGKLDEALASAEAAVALKPDFAEGYNNWGIALRGCHRLDEAADKFRRALELEPDFPLARFNLGTTHLLAGNYREGWSGYAAYSELADTPARQILQPRWNGGPLAGRRLLVFADQGFGDTLQFARFLPLAKERSAAHVIFQCQRELASLLRHVVGVDELVAEGADVPQFDEHVSLTDLAGVLAIDLATLPRDVSYVPPPSELRAELQELLEQTPAGNLKVGLVWQGNPRQARDVLRSCRLTELVPLGTLPGTTFFSLQTDEPSRGQIAQVVTEFRLIDAGAHLHDFADTAALMQHLDLVITVDTAVAHLAGALGLPVWTMLCHTPDWRWLLTRDDSPSYPTMRLFRQPAWGDWGSVVSVVRAELKKFLGGH